MFLLTTSYACFPAGSDSGRGLKIDSRLCREGFPRKASLTALEYHGEGGPNSSKSVLDISSGASSGTMCPTLGMSFVGDVGLKRSVTKSECAGTGKRLSFVPQINTR